jgi:hypothetical protein
MPGIRDFDSAHGANRLLAILPAQAASSSDIRALIDWQSALP